MTKLFFIFLSLFVFMFQPVAAQFKTIDASARDTLKSTEICIAWWNLENLFDTIDDPGKGDDDFLPSGKKQWTQDRLHYKITNLASVIASMNPDVLGFCEVEHESLIDSLLNYLPKKYGKVYYESSDRRGIDVGMIYNKNILSLIHSEKHTVSLKGRPTREIIEVSLAPNSSLPFFRGGLGRGLDTLSSRRGLGRGVTFLLNHWPSRLGGKLESEPRRLNAAKTARKIIDNTFAMNKDAPIILLGDFNDEPFDRSLTDVLKATEDKHLVLDSNYLFNPMIALKTAGLGTHRHGDNWNLLDQFIVSRSVMPFLTDVRIFNSESMYLKTKNRSADSKKRPWPTYSGSKYLGGYSDHLPIVISLNLYPLLFEERARERFKERVGASAERSRSVRLQERPQ